MPRLLKISELRFGLQASPGFQGNRIAPYYLENIEINDEGRAETRPGYAESEQAFEGSGDQLAVLHFVGDRFHEGVSRFRRLPLEDRIVLFGRRLFFVGESAGLNSWHNVNTNRAFAWDYPKPLQAPGVEIITAASGTPYTWIHDYPKPFPS